MKKTLITLMMAACMLLSACGTGAVADPTPESDAAITFTDDLGRTVTVERPERVAALLGSFAQVWMLAGGEICAAPDDVWNDLALLTEESDAVNLGSIHSLSLELLLSAQPDFILASTNTRQNVEWRDTLEAIGVPVAYFDINNFDDYLQLLEVCTDITGQKEQYETYGTAVRQEIDDAIALSQQRLETEDAPTVLCMVASASGIWAKNSDGSVLGTILRDLGCTNIADSDAMLLETISMEQILQADPEYIFFIQRGDNVEGMHEHVRSVLTDDPAWAALTAAKENRVYFMEKALFNLKPNHRWGEAYAIAEEILANGR